jgi:hypothetical protein
VTVRSSHRNPQCDRLSEMGFSCAGSWNPLLLFPMDSNRDYIRSMEKTWTIDISELRHKNDFNQESECGKFCYIKSRGSTALKWLVTQKAPESLTFNFPIFTFWFRLLYLNLIIKNKWLQHACFGFQSVKILNLISNVKAEAKTSTVFINFCFLEDW